MQPPFDAVQSARRAARGEIEAAYVPYRVTATRWGVTHCGASKSAPNWCVMFGVNYQVIEIKGFYFVARPLR